jgi:hypothetical protein
MHCRKTGILQLRCNFIVNLTEMRRINVFLNFIHLLIFLIEQGPTETLHCLPQVGGGKTTPINLAQCSKLSLSDGPALSRRLTSSSPEDGNRTHFRNAVYCSECWTTHGIWKHSPVASPYSFKTDLSVVTDTRHTQNHRYCYLLSSRSSVCI